MRSQNHSVLGVLSPAVGKQTVQGEGGGGEGKVTGWEKRVVMEEGGGT